MDNSTSVFYLFASLTGNLNASSSAVFYKVEGEWLAKSLCSLFTREYSDESSHATFHCQPATSFSVEDQVLLDESLGWVDFYDDPDRGVYDPPPPRDIHLRAQYAVRASKWEALLRGRQESFEKSTTEGQPDSPHGNESSTDELPVMSVEDRRNSGLILLLLLAQAYYKMLESTVSMASWVTALDLELNQCYLWTVKNIANLLKNHPDLKDFPSPFEPLFPDLYPSTIRDVEWEDMVGPDAEQFLSSVQKYVHDHGFYEPEKGSPAWVFVELFRPSVNAAIEKANAYNSRMRQLCRKWFIPKVGAGRGTSSGNDAQSDGSIKRDATSPEPSANPEKRFRIALSYPGEHGSFVQEVAEYLSSKIARERVLYDKYHEAEFARPDLDIYLPNLYRAESELVAIFLCAEYSKKRWCKLEWRFIRQLICTSEVRRIMFLSFDAIGAIPEIGILSGDGYVSIGERTPHDIADLILIRLQVNAGNDT
jgi:hypothetical protein